MTEVNPEATVRRVRPPRAERVRPDIRPDIGWQSPPLPQADLSIACPHIGRFAAALQSSHYALGTEWICVCGQVFVVAINAGDKRTLMEATKVPVEVVDMETGVETPPKNPDKPSRPRDEKPRK